MAATKRKRRGGLSVQAKKPKKSEKDAKQPAKLRDMAEEAEEEGRDRIPGPVCKVERRYLLVAPAAAALHASLGLSTYLMRVVLISELPVCYASSVSNLLPVGQSTALTARSRARGRPPGGGRLGKWAGFGTPLRKRFMGYSASLCSLLVTPFSPCGYCFSLKLFLAIEYFFQCLVFPYSTLVSYCQRILVMRSFEELLSLG